MKKLPVLLLTGIMMALPGMAACAQEDPAGPFEKVGIHMTLPEEMTDLKGVFLPDYFGLIADDPEIYYMTATYFAMPEEKFEYYWNLPEEDYTEEIVEEIDGLQTLVCELFAIRGDSEDLYETFGLDENSEEIGFEELGKSDEFTFFCIPTDGTQYLTKADDSFVEEFLAVQDMMMNAVRTAEFRDPSSSAAGKGVSFSSTDLEGETLLSEDLFAANEITMINYWATWCGPCVGELEELAQIHSRLQEKGCGIVGILQDTEKAKEAEELMAENGTNYPVVLESDDMDFLDDVYAFPASFFVDREGNIVAGPIYGAAVDEYESTVDGLLETGMTETEADAGH